NLELFLPSPDPVRIVLRFLRSPKKRFVCLRARLLRRTVVYHPASAGTAYRSGTLWMLGLVAVSRVVASGSVHYPRPLPLCSTVLNHPTSTQHVI
uniref:Uncharacterized protein n=1 Tax=Anopheles minimus TaxID=112268 RepID=A0A182WNN5_9DIPT